MLEKQMLYEMSSPMPKCFKVLLQKRKTNYNRWMQTKRSFNPLGILGMNVTSLSC